MEVANLAAIAFLLVTSCASAQTLDELRNDGQNSENVATYGMGYSLQRYSPLVQINKSTVKRLVPIWSLSLNNDLGEQAQPLIYNGVMYVTNVKWTVAIDVATGRQIWRTPVEWDPATPRVVCCGVSNKGPAIYNGKLFRTTLDAFVVALDMNTGKEVWKQKFAEWKEGYSSTAAPLVANGVLITGMSGAEYGVRGFLDGWNPDSGAKLWRRYTVPGPGDNGFETWPADTNAYQHGGGSTWITGSYDPDLDLVYWGTGNAAPWNPSLRSGDSLYTAGVVAIRPKTGEIVWHYQWTPNDMYDYDGVNENVLADIKIDNQMRKVLVHADRNGFLYVLDRINGKVIAAHPFEKINWAERIDIASGRPVLTDLSSHLIAGEELEIWPGVRGGKNWAPMAFNPETGLVYLSSLHRARVVKFVSPGEYKPGQRFVGAETKIPQVPAEEPWGYYMAVDPLTGETKWKFALSDFAIWAGTLATKGGLIFIGKQTGEFIAIDEANGQILWQFQTGSGINSSPITYTLKGRQFVTVLSGLGGLSAVTGTPVRQFVPPGGSVWTFALMPEQ
jgi:alcohol dehydrogenase (cytochrome c)